MDQATTRDAHTASNEASAREADYPREPRSFTANVFNDWDIIALRYLEEDPENG